MFDADDADVLRRFGRGDREAFETLYRQYHREVYTWILRIVRDPAAAEDVVIEAFWRAYRSHARFDPDRRFGPWMRRIATNAAVDQLRVLAARPVQYDEGDIAADDTALTMDVRRHVDAAMQSLPTKLRVVAVLALIEDQTLADIAQALDVPLGTVKSRLFRATRALRERLTNLGIQP